MCFCECGEIRGEGGITPLQWPGRYLIEWGRGTETKFLPRLLPNSFFLHSLHAADCISRLRMRVSLMCPISHVVVNRVELDSFPVLFHQGCNSSRNWRFCQRTSLLPPLPPINLSLRLLAAHLVYLSIWSVLSDFFSLGR